MRLSVCVVTYQARELLRGCLTSLYQNTESEFEVVVVDNGSNDGVVELLQREFPEVRLEQNESNLGFTHPMNQALQLAQGCYLMQLNPDTVVLPGALDTLLSFMEAHPEAGICGPKVLNTDHTLQKSCRRGEPTPWAVITYFSGLARLFPRSSLFGKYQLSYLDEDQTNLVAGVSGSCMLIRRQVVEQIGYLDELFFAYQEDADYCRRARQAGWLVYYVPEARIIHYGGMGGSRVQPYRSIVAWHKSYFLYYRKHLAKNYFFLLNWFYYALMVVKLVLSLSLNFLRKGKFAPHRND